MNTPYDKWIVPILTSMDHVVGIVLKGSHARGEAHALSDLDFDVLTNAGPNEGYLSRYEPGPAGLQHISTAVRDVDNWLAGEQEPAPWAMGLAARETTRLLWAKDSAWRRRLDRRWLTHPAATPELEDCTDALAKLRAAMLRGDELTLRLAARQIGDNAPAMVSPIVPYTPPQSASEALTTALRLPGLHEDWADDLATCLGQLPRGKRAIAIAAFRLVSSIVRRMEAQAALYEPLLTPDEYAQLTGGQTAAWIRHVATTTNLSLTATKTDVTHLP